MSACEQKFFDAAHPDVKAFINLVVEGKYDSYAPLPAFRPDDIPALLNNWWYNRRDKDFEEYKDINPLDGSDYRWR